MSKIQTIYTKESELKTKRKKMIKNSTYAVIIVSAIMLGATLVAVNTQNKNDSNLTIQTSVSDNNYSLPMENVTVLKDYNGGELQYNDTLKQWEIHKAIDLVSDTSDNVFAIAKGTVTNVYTNYLEGTVIEISHSNGLVSVYKSLSQDVSITLGDAVKAGQKIGTVGSTMARELNSGNHLHLEIYSNNEAVNPNDYIDFSKK